MLFAAKIALLNCGIFSAILTGMCIKDDEDIEAIFCLICTIILIAIGTLL